MQYSDVVTFFHEFGHLMHAILGGQQAWAGVSGIATEGDFVEVPSQMLEEFFHDAQLLASFARHYQTGEPIPRGAGGTHESRECFRKSRRSAHPALLYQLRARCAQPASRSRLIRMRCSKKVTNA